jgi:PilZ domain
MRNDQFARQVEPRAASGSARRRHERARFTSKVVLLLETRDGLATVSGYVLDVSESGCALLFQNRVEPHLVGRVRLPLGGQDVWIPIVTRWARAQAQGWMVGAEFDRPTREKQDLVRRFVSQRIG